MPNEMVAAQSQILRLNDPNKEFLQTENENFAVINFRKLGVEKKVEAFRKILEEISQRNLDEKSTILICTLFTISHRAIKNFISVQKLTNFEKIFLFKKSPDAIFDLFSALDQIRPKYLIIIDPTLSLIRTAYQYKISQRGIPLRTYLITFSGGIDGNLIAFQEKIENENFDENKENEPVNFELSNESQKKVKLIFFDLETTSIKEHV